MSRGEWILRKADVGEERIHQKGSGGYGAQEGTVPRSAPPASDKPGGNR